jgi:hypothetical protein
VLIKVYNSIYFVLKSRCLKLLLLKGALIIITVLKVNHTRRINSLLPAINIIQYLMKYKYMWSLAELMKLDIGNDNELLIELKKTNFADRIK